VVWLTTLQPSCADCLKIWEPQPTGTRSACQGLQWVYFTFTLIYIQQDANLHSLFYLETALHVSGGAITHHQERKQIYLQHLVFVTPLLLCAPIVEELELG
jgi:hypothetical protein